ncbi:hypothetical protein BH10PSE1_BH10PSE1_28260 [soil metagenome]
MAMQQTGSPFAAGDIASQPAQPDAFQPIDAPRPFWDHVERRAQGPSPQARIAAEEARIQGALWDRHRQVEALLGRRVPPSMMMSGQNSLDGFGGLSDLDYEARIEAMRQEFPDQLSGVESRGDITARLAGQPAITFYETSHGPAQATTRQDGSLWLETNDGYTGPLSRFPGARPVRRSGAADVTQGDGSVAGPRVRSLGERFTSTVEDMAHTNPIMALGRWAAGGGYDEYEDPETGQTLRYANFGQQARDQERERRDAYRMMAAGDSWNSGDASLLHKLARGAVTLTGAVTGSAADPTAMIAPGEGVIGRILGGVAVNAAGDAITQGADIGSGIQDRYDPMQTVTAAAIGGVIQGGLEGAGAVTRRLSGNPGGVVEALANEINYGSMDLTRPLSAEGRAALARIDAERQDVERIGPVGGEAHEEAAAALDRSEVPASPEPERDLDQLFDTGALNPTSPTSSLSSAAITGLDSAEYQGRRIWSGAFDPMEVEADPTRFQYKAAGDEGLTDRLAGVTTWDRTAAGRSILFEDGDGRVVVADGHQRRGLARRLIENGDDITPTLDGFLFRQADGWEPGEVRVIAAMKNLRESSGTILDAAKVFREAPTLINDRSLPITGDFIANARGLARLSDDAFGAVANGVIPERYGAVIGELAPDRADLHSGMVDLMREGGPRSIDEARALVQESRLADFAESAGLQGDMFGGVPAQSTLIARARLRVAVMKQLRGDARLFAALIKNADAIEAGGNALAHTANEARLARDLAASAGVDRLSLRVGQVGDTFGAAATAITRGDMTTAAGARAIVDELRSASDLAEAVAAERRIVIDPARPTTASTDALRSFDRPGGEGQAAQIAPKPEDAAREADAGTVWDDLPEIGEEQRALDVLRVCAPGKA